MKRKQLTLEQEQELIEYYKNHSNIQTQKRYQISDLVLFSILEKYNTPRHSKRDNMIFTSTERYGGLGFATESHRQKVQQTCLEKYGTPSFFNHEKNWQTKIQHYGSKQDYIDYWQQKRNKTLNERYGSKEAAYEHIKTSCQTTLQDRYGVQNISQIPGVASKKSKHILEDGMTFDSSWELEVYHYFKLNGLHVKRNIPIDFEVEGRLHRTFIDFEVDGYLFEVKGNHLLGGCFDSAPSMVPIESKLHIYSSNNVNVITSFSDTIPTNMDVNFIDIKLFQQYVDWEIVKSKLVK